MANQKKLILYGAGDYGKRYLEKLGSEKVFAFADSDIKMVGKYINGKKVLSIKELTNDKDNIILFPSVGVDKWEEVIYSIVQNGLGQCIVYTLYPHMVKLEKHAYHGIDVIWGGNNLLGSYSYIDKSEIGYASYIGTNTTILNAIIGKYSSIGPNVHIISGQHPTHKFVSTYPAFYAINHSIGFSYVNEQKFEEFRYVQEGVSIRIGNDVWIGDGVSIMEGVTIADGTIVAAGAMVVKDTEPYSIVGGIPARILSYRFTKDKISFLLKLKWWDKEEIWIKENAKYFDDVDRLYNKLK